MTDADRENELNDLRMSEKAVPLYNQVKDFIREVEAVVGELGQRGHGPCWPDQG